MVFLHLWSSGSNAQDALRALEECHRVSSKSPSRVQDRDEGVAGRSVRGVPDEGSLIYAPGKSMLFYEKETEKIELMARPGFYQNKRHLGKR